MRLDGASVKDSAAQCEMARTPVIAAFKAYQANWIRWIGDEVFPFIL